MSHLSIPRLLVSALSGGSGKTMLSLGISRALLERGFKILPFKKGADYIDTAWLALSAKEKAYNLDPFFLDKAQLRSHFCHKSKTENTHAIAIIEGNRGLFDGKDKEGSASSAEIAINLQCPVILCIDCTKMTRTVAAIVQGMVGFQPEVAIKGVVLNNIASLRHERVIRESIDQYCTVPVLGSLPRFRKNPLPERHHGLVLNASNPENEEVLENLASLCEEYVDMSALIQLANSAPDIEYIPIKKDIKPTHVRIGYVEDKALWFYYRENLEFLQDAGAELVSLSLFHKENWDSIHGLYLGGGYPELYVEEIVTTGILPFIKNLSEENLPIFAECGGFMLLGQSLQRGNTIYPMAEIFPVLLDFHKKPQGLGYVEGTFHTDSCFFSKNTKIIGHEFHYSACISPPTPTLISLSKGTGMGNSTDGLEKNKTFAMYTHIYAPATKKWAKQFVQLATEYKNRISYA